MGKGGKQRGKNKGSKKAEKLLVLAMAVALLLCGASIAVGVMNWVTRAYGDDITDNVRIEVLNGTGENGLGRTVARALMRKKVDVLLVGNADGTDYPQTVLIARKRKPEVESLGELIGCERFVEQLREDTTVDATLIIGADYRKLDLGLEDESNLSE
jgi:NAD(P)H-hydrate repair Nnr-like enzyme with NAD(P)H-hydrate epimerase domain